MKQRPVQPVAPTSMNVFFGYACPHCGQLNHVPAQLKPTQIHCGQCGFAYPLIPVDERTLHFMHIMLDNGRAAADADFV